jgi:hypothetical protein
MLTNVAFDDVGYETLRILRDSMLHLLHVLASETKLLI